MADENFTDQVRAAEEASMVARLTADSINLAAWGENNTESGPPWVALHSRTVDQLCEHIDNLVRIITRGSP